MCELSPGAGVVTTRGDVHYVVTEYGVAYLHGKTVQERAMALISVAHPDFREKLLKDAIQSKYIRSEMDAVSNKITTGPESLRTTFLLDNGTQINFRSIQPTDVPGIKALFYHLSSKSVYYRFMSRMKALSQKQLQNFVFINRREEVSIVGTVPEAHGEEIVAVGRYFLDPRTNRAELAFVTHDGWQGRGIGTFLCKYLVKIARRNGIGGLTAEVLQENKRMQAVFNNMGLKMKSTLEEGVYSYVLDFE
jgi:GNAT superfamily N-acetyltransferase